jgi:hypothetical protein
VAAALALNDLRGSAAARLLSTTGTMILFAACHSNTTSPTGPTTPPAPSSSFAVTFDENPAPFRSTGCSASTPQGWYTAARLRETAGVTFTVSTLIQKLDGNVATTLTESFNSRFGACAASSFTPGMILANGAVCASVGVCTSSSFGTYQFQITGTDANGHMLTFDSPVLQLGPRPSGQSIPSSFPAHEVFAGPRAR